MQLSHSFVLTLATGVAALDLSALLDGSDATSTDATRTDILTEAASMLTSYLGQATSSSGSIILGKPATGESLSTNNTWTTMTFATPSMSTSEVLATATSAMTVAITSATGPIVTPSITSAASTLAVASSLTSSLVSSKSSGLASDVENVPLMGVFGSFLFGIAALL